MSNVSPYRKGRTFDDVNNDPCLNVILILVHKVNRSLLYEEYALYDMIFYVNLTLSFNFILLLVDIQIYLHEQTHI